MTEFINFIPIIIATLGMIFVSFLNIKKKNKAMSMIIAFVLWLATFAITWFSLLK